MGKIRTVEDLDRKIDIDISWRKRELTTTLKVIEQSLGLEQKANLRSGILLLYAHWEGWVKSVSKLYIRYVNTIAPPYNNLSEAFLGNALKTRMRKIESTTKSREHNQFATFLRTSMAKSANFSEDLVRTDSNLSSDIFFDLLDRLGLEHRSEFVTNANLIDSSLVKRRNSIAHGEYLDLSVDEFRSLKEKVMELLELFTNDVRNSASTGSYLAIPVPGP